MIDLLNFIMKPGKQLLIFLACIAISCKTPATKPEKPVIAENKATQINDLAKRYLELGRFSGTILIAKKDTLLYSNNFGFADYEQNIPFSQETAFKIGEISEVATANIVHDLAESGKINLSEKVSVYLPEIEGDFTIRELLDHSAGLKKIKTIAENNPNMEYSAIAYANAASGDSIQDVGKSDLGYNLLGILIESITGKSYQENMENYSSQLALDNTYFQKPDSLQAIGYLFHNHRGSGLELEKSDLYDVQKAFSSKGLKATGKDVLRILRASEATDIRIDGYLEEDGFSYAVHKDAKTNLQIVVLSNRKHPVAGELVNSINAILAGETYVLPLQRKPVDIEPSVLEEYAGTYSLNEQMNLNIVTEKDSLFVLMGPNKVFLVPQSKNQFYMEERDASVRFLRNETNAVDSAVLLDGFIEGNKIERVRN